MKSHCRLDPSVYIGRIYNEPVDVHDSIDNMPAFNCVFSVFAAGHIAFIHAMHGEFNKAVYESIKDQLKQRNIKTVMWERHTKNGVILKTVHI